MALADDLPAATRQNENRVKLVNTRY